MGERGQGCSGGVPGFAGGAKAKVGTETEPSPHRTRIAMV